MNDFLFLMGVYGVSMILVQSKIMKPFRDFVSNKANPIEDSAPKTQRFYLFLNELLKCMMCTSFWVALISNIFFFYLKDIYLDIYSFVGLFITIFLLFFKSAMIAALVWFLYLIQLNLERYVKDEL